MASNTPDRVAFINAARARILANTVADLSSDSKQKRMQARADLRRKSRCCITGCTCWRRFAGDAGPFLCRTLDD